MDSGLEDAERHEIAARDIRNAGVACLADLDRRKAGRVKEDS